jgi:hypothetical protein
MTRRGTLAYYLAAWVIGCFVVAVLQWVGEAFAGEVHTASILLTTYFFALIFGAVAVLLFAFLLRRWMRLIGSHTQWTWLVSGAALALLQTYILIHAQSALLSIRTGQFGEFLFAAILNATDSLSGRNLWQAPVDGAITAYVLWLVDRAFSSPNETTSEPKHSPAEYPTS